MTGLASEDSRDLLSIGRLAAKLSAAHRPEALQGALGRWLHREFDAYEVTLRLETGGENTEPWRADIDSISASDVASRNIEGRHRQSIEIPVTAGDDRIATIECVSPARSTRRLESDTELCDAVAQIVGLACARTRVLSKVASLSRKAHETSAQLRAQLTETILPTGIVAASPAMREVLHQADLVAPHATPVLIRGASGTGKEVVARYIHERSGRRKCPFVAVNCAALPEALIESELFGHEKGAFTGSTSQHRGRFERASGGTLMLDEVAELPVATQAKLLRALQEQAIERVGGSEEIPIDVRVIAATHQPIEARIADGLFRADLYYRLDVFPIVIADLHRRPEDVVEFARRKLAALSARFGDDAPHLSPQQLRALCAAPWPGNVRELENTIERAAIMSPPGTIELPPLPTREGTPPPNSPAHAAADRSTGRHPAPTLDESTRLAISDALSASRGKIYGPGGAAEVLEVKPSTLQAKMTRLGLRRADYT